MPARTIDEVRWWVTGLWLSLIGCGGEPVTRCVISPVDELSRVDAIADDGTLIAYTIPGAVDRDLYVTAATCGSEPTLVASGVASARFCGTTVLAFRPGAFSFDLLGWNSGDSGLTLLGENVDMGATRCSPDGLALSVETHDDDGLPGVDLELINMTDLGVRQLATVSVARARFTNDSRQIVYSGSPPGGGEITIWRDSIAGGEILQVASSSATERWEIAPDDLSLFYVPRPGVLARRSFADGDVELRTDLASLPSGKAFDVSSDGTQVAYLVNDPTFGLFLHAIPSAGGDQVTLFDAPVVALVDHYPGLVVFRTVEGMRAVAPTGGEVWSLGGLEIADRNQVAVVMHWLGQVTLVPLPASAPIAIASDAMPDEPFQQNVALSADDRVIVRRVGAVLDLVDPGSGESTTLLDWSGNFVVAPDRTWLAAIGDAEVGRTLLRVTLP